MKMGCKEEQLGDKEQSGFLCIVLKPANQAVLTYKCLIFLEMGISPKNVKSIRSTDDVAWIDCATMLLIHLRCLGIEHPG